MSVSSEVLTLVKILQHQQKVSAFLRMLARDLEMRADIHDMSKLNFDEFVGFCEMDIARSHQKEKFNSEQYKSSIAMNDAVKLHWSRNSHHPQHYSGGLDNMNHFDIIEMLYDWEVARMDRDTEEDIEKTWKSRQDMFGLTHGQIKFLRTIWKGLPHD